MVRGFEEYTHGLTGFELNTVMPKLGAILSSCTGPDKAVTNRQIRAQLLARYNLEVSDPRVRAMINELRTSDAVPYLVASSKGYYIAGSVEEVEDYARSLDSRIREMARVRDALLGQVEGKLFLEQGKPF